jgi:DNA-3-methyladenine glycosylase II
MTHIKSYRVYPPYPYSLALTTSTWNRWNPQYRYYDGQTFWQTMMYKNKPYLASVQQKGKELLIKVTSNIAFSADDYKEIKKQIIKLLNLDIDLNKFYKYINEGDDKVMKSIIKQLRGLLFNRISSLFEAFVIVIVSQEIASSFALKIIQRIYEGLGKKFKLNGQVYYTFPTAKEVYETPNKWFRGLSIPEKKVGYIKNIAKMFIEKKLGIPKLKAMKDGELAKFLDDLPGVGSWTASSVMLRGCARLDVDSRGDLDVKKAFQLYYKVTDKNKMNKIIERWGPWKGLASLYLITAKRMVLKMG